MSHKAQPNIGDRAEQIVYLAAKLLSERDSLIENAAISEHGSAIDALGVDVLVLLKTGLAIPIQVKTWSPKTRARRKTRYEHFRKHPHILLVVVKPHKRNAAIEMSYHLGNLIHRFLAGKKVPIPNRKPPS